MPRLPRRLPLAALAALTAASLGAQGAPRCGVERWRVKVLMDPDAGRVDTTRVLDTTIAALAAVPPPARRPSAGRVAPTETQVFRVRAVIAQVLSEDDGDLHLVLRDPTDPSRTMIGEIPDSACALGSGLEPRYAAVRRALRALPRRAIVDVEGVGFFDFAHGQRGAAPNSLELHPILRITQTTSATPAVPPPPRDPPRRGR